MLVVELVRRLEQDARAMQFFARRRLRRPCGVAQCEIELRLVHRFVSQPTRHMLCECKFRKLTAEQHGQLRAQCEAVHDRGIRSLVLVHGLALHEQTLATEQRCKLVVTCRQHTNFRLDTEQFRDEIFNVRRQCYQQFGLLLGGERFRIKARFAQALAQRAIGGAQRVHEFSVEFQQPAALIKIGKLQIKTGAQHHRHTKYQQIREAREHNINQLPSQAAKQRYSFVR